VAADRSDFIALGNPKIGNQRNPELFTRVIGMDVLLRNQELEVGKKG
jgi:hypothetical protein